MPLRLHDEVGGSTTELVLLMPVVVTSIMLVVQVGLYLHARQVVEAAAQEALETAQTEAGDAETGRADAEAFLIEAGGVREAAVEVTRRNDEVRVRVSGAAPNVVPGAVWQVRAAVQGAVERFIAETDR